MLQIGTMVPSVSEWPAAQWYLCWPNTTASLEGFAQAKFSSKHFLHSLFVVSNGFESPSQVPLNRHTRTWSPTTQWAAVITFREFISEPPHCAFWHPTFKTFKTWTCQGIECGVTSSPPAILELIDFCLILALPHSNNVNPNDPKFDKSKSQHLGTV